ncbi:hypothetical protein [Algisphaera agarilytica]|uniref:Uncharacterized protein n=1 Tax=Algisphaera agarilytica TaxID=1385975 RepID=A0A7X0H5Q9_9BACT|nr:hypothetical protein [Algisphaera agarilytica]MBB6428304.1 hypothetical protein [Algisphaera agarilytica]
MSIRSVLQDKPLYGAIGAVVVLVLAGFLVYNASSGQDAGGLVTQWGYDLNTGKIVKARAEQLPPFDTGSGTFDYPDLSPGGAGVYAQIYTCGDPSEINTGMTAEDLAEVGARLTSVTRYSDGVLDALANESVEGGIDLTQALLLSDLTGQSWIPEQSPAAIRIRQPALSKCDSGEYPVLAVP